MTTLESEPLQPNPEYELVALLDDIKQRLYEDPQQATAVMWSEEVTIVARSGYFITEEDGERLSSSITIGQITTGSSDRAFIYVTDAQGRSDGSLEMPIENPRLSGEVGPEVGGLFAKLRGCLRFACFTPEHTAAYEQATRAKNRILGA